MAKNKKRRIIVVAALCCAMLLLFFPIVYSPPAETAYLSSEPWAKEVKFVGWDYVRYNYYLYRNIMLGYPWVVRMAYTIVFFCCVATFLLFIAMAWDVYRRRKLDRKNERLRKRYYDKIMELARMDHSLSIPEIKSAIEYIHLSIIDHVKELLAGTNKTVSEIAYEVGFQYPHHLSRMFKKTVGYTPNEYRKAYSA